MSTFFHLFFSGSILKNNQITCIDAAFLLAYSIYRREKNTLVYSFTDKADTLEKLHPLMNRDYKGAKKAVEEHMVCQKILSFDVRPTNKD